MLTDDVSSFAASTDVTMRMRTYSLRRLCWAAALLAGVVWFSAEGQPAVRLPTESQVTNLDWRERRDAFARLVGTDPISYSRSGLPSVRTVLEETLENDEQNANERTARLITLLETENREAARAEEEFLSTNRENVPGPGRLSEEYVTYYGDVVAAVALLGDSRALDVLVGAVGTGGMATRALIAFGPPAVRPIARIFETSRSLVERSSAVRVLSDMLKEPASTAGDPGSRAIIKDVVTRAARDESFLLRKNAVVGLVRLGDTESVALAERIAETDPYRAEFADNRYVVREAAQEALATIR